MSKRLVFILAVLGVCLLITIILVASRPSEPTYQNHTFTEWVWMMHRARGPQQEQYRAIVRQLGSNSIPMLAAWLHEPDTKSNPTVEAIKFELYKSLRRFRLIGRAQPDHVITAARASAELDSADKKVLVSDVLQMIQATYADPEITAAHAMSSTIALPFLAPESIPPLIDLLTNQNPAVVLYAAQILAEIKTNTQPAIPILERQLTNPDPTFRLKIADTLGQIGGDPANFVPVVIKGLPLIDQDDVADYLPLLENNAAVSSNAIPFLLKYYHSLPADSANNPTRAQVLTTLKTIAPHVNPDTPATNSESSLPH